MTDSNQDPTELVGRKVATSTFGKSVLSLLPTEVDGEPSSSTDPSNQLPGVSPGNHRYTIHEEIARGGMGAVFRGHDHDLRRELAIKVILDRHIGSPDIVRRFVEEARIGGQLQHPGIVPVHELGKLDDERFYFSMKLVEGESLHALLKERRDLEERRGHFIKVFEQICQTMAYAHSRQVIHRDLKPSNVMVGAFGEVQVMDWGLAKSLINSPRESYALESDANPEKAAPNRNENVSEMDTDSIRHEPTRFGSIIGTPAFMPMEQALGDINLIEKPSDVFGLGSVLCVILTGKPPYSCKTPQETLELAQAGDVSAAFARLDESTADPELIQIAKDCLARRPEDRPANAEVVAQRVSGHLASVEARLKQAELDGIQARTKAAEERKRRRVTMALAASLLAIVGVGATAFSMIQSQKTQLANQEAENAKAEAERQLAELEDRRNRSNRARDALAEATSLQQRAGLASSDDLLSWTNALAAAKRAEALTLLGEVDTGLAEKTAAVRKQLEAKVADQQLIQALDTAWNLDAEDLASQAELETASNTLLLASPRVLPYYHEAFTSWGSQVVSTESNEFVERVQLCSDDIQDRIIVALDRMRELHQHEDNAETTRWLDQVLQVIDEDEWRKGFRKEANENDMDAIIRRVVDTEITSQPVIVWVRCALALQRGAKPREAFELLQRLNQAYPGDYWVNFSLALSLADHRPPRLNESLRHATASAALRPQNATAQYGVARLVRESYRIAENVLNKKELAELASQYATTAVRLDPQNPVCLNMLGLIQFDLGHQDEAIETLKTATTVAPEDAQAHHNISSLLISQGKNDEAITLIKRAMQLEPKSFAPHMNMGDILVNQGAITEGIQNYDKAAELDTNSPKPHNNKGVAYMMTGKYSEALSAFQKAIQIAPHHVKALYNAGLVESQMGNDREALGYYQRVTALAGNHADAYDSIAVSHERLGEIDEALLAWQRSLQLHPENAATHYNLAVALARQGRYPDAIKHWETSAQLEPNNPMVYGNLGKTYQRMGYLEKAAEMFQQGVSLAPEHPQLRIDLGLCFYKQDRLEECERQIRKALEIAPNHARAQQLHNEITLILKARELMPMILEGTAKIQNNDLAIQASMECADLGHYAAAARLCRESFERDPSLQDDIQSRLRFDAACWAAQAGSGSDDRVKGAEERDAWREQSLDWLKAELTTVASELDGKLSNDQRQDHIDYLEQWLSTQSLADVRNRNRLGFLSKEERHAWEDFWEQVREVASEGKHRESKHTQDTDK